MRKTFQDRVFAVREYFATLLVSRLRRRVFVAGVVIFGLAAIFLFTNKGLVRRIMLSNEKKELEEQVRALQRTQDSLKMLRDQLQRDTFMIEKTAREQYGMTRPGETVYRVEKPANSRDSLK